MQSVSDQTPALRGRRVAVPFSIVLFLSGCWGATPGSPDADAVTITTAATTETPPSPTDTGTTGPTAPAPVTGSSPLPVAGPGTIHHPAGLDLSYPDGWQETGTAVIATQFATNARCAAALIVDQAPPTDPAQAGFVLQSAVQVCATPTDGVLLDTYMESVYGTGVPGFAPDEVDGRIGFRHDDGLQSLIFIQTDSFRIQVATFVAADPDVEAARLAQVQQILESLRFS